MSYFYTDSMRNGGIPFVKPQYPSVTVVGRTLNNGTIPAIVYADVLDLDQVLQSYKQVYQEADRVELTIFYD